MRYFTDIRHDELGKFRRVGGSDPYVVRQKVIEQLSRWETEWQRRCMVEEVRRVRQLTTAVRERKKQEAVVRTEDAEQAIADLRNILAKTLEKHDAIDWSPIYDHDEFAEKPPKQPGPPTIAAEPTRGDAIFTPKRSFLSVLLPFVRRKRQLACQKAFELSHAQWKVAAANAVKAHEIALDVYRRALAQWQQRKTEFESNQRLHNSRIDALRERYLNKDQDAVIEYIDMVLSRSEYPSFFPQQWAMEYRVENSVLILDYELPQLADFPAIRSVKYVQSRDDFDEAKLRDSEISQIYDDAIYQTCLRTIHEIFESDVIDAVQSVALNGWVTFVDKARGTPTRACIVSLQTLKTAFEKINLAAVEPKACFRALRGVGSAKLAGMAPVTPILQLVRTDERFIPARDVIQTIDSATNVAAISWEDFEHLIRDLFEKEFAIGGGEVKITRASRDHGVDAIAFDPDPIRGGKIVIQAKRYTNPVGVSAVRDLYGTVINEGATKGILVTTAVYGPDSYEFAKGKPITLLDGGNLLSLLAKHGHRARIDLAEAKRIASLDE